MTLFVHFDPQTFAVLDYPIRHRAAAIQLTGHRFGRNATDEELALGNLARVREVDPDAVEEDEVVESEPERLPDGAWRQRWQVVPGGRLPDIRAAVAAEVDDRADDKLSRAEVGGVGRLMVEVLRFDELSRFEVDPAPDPVDYPLLASERMVRGGTVAEAVLRVNDRRMRLAVRLARLEQARSAALAKAASAPDAATARSAVDDVERA